MTKDEQRRQAQQLRQEGYSFGHIARTLGVASSTVKSWCYRTAEPPSQKEQTAPRNVCPQCGGALPPARYRVRRFCSDACRAGYWRAHSDEINRRSTVEGVCPVCRKPFRDYARRHRKYCSHACYIAARYHGGALDG